MKNLRIFQLIPLFVLLFLPIGLLAEGVYFEKDSFQAALAKAKSEDKLLFVDAVTDWCGPCKWMAKEVFPHEEVSAFFNQHFINLKVDMEKGEGPELAKKYDVRAYPTLMFIDGEGEVTTRVLGGRSVAALLVIGERVVNGIQPIETLNATFESGKYERKWLFDYIMRLTDERLETKDAVAAFRPGMGGEQLLKKDNWTVFEMHLRDIGTPEFEYVMTNIERFREELGKETVDNKLGMNYSMALFTSIREKQFERYDSLRTLALSIGIEGADKQMLRFDLRKFEQQLSPENYALMVVGMVESGKISDSGSLNEFAWKFYETQEDPDMLALALKWVEKAIEKGKNSLNMDTYGMLLFKTGQQEQAIAACNEAIKLAIAEGDDPSATEKEMAKWLAQEDAE